MLTSYARVSAQDQKLELQRDALTVYPKGGDLPITGHEPPRDHAQEAKRSAD